MTTALKRRAATGVAMLATVAGVSVLPALTVAPASATTRSDTSLSIRTVHSGVAPGRSTAVTGALVVHGLDDAGRTVTLEAKPQGTESFVPIAEAVTRDHGGLRVKVTPATTTRYRWHYAGDAETQPSVSGIARIRVRTPDHPATRINTTLAVRSLHRVVDPGGANVIRGRLAAHRVPVQHRWVVLLSRTPGSEGWAFGSVDRTGPDGRVAFEVTPDERSAYRLVFLGTPLLQPVRSAVVHVGVRPTVTATATPDVVDPGETTTISGVVVTAGGLPVAGATVELLARRIGSHQGLEVVGTGTTAADGSVAIAATPLRSQFYRLRVLRTEGVPRALSPRVRVAVRAPTSLSIRGRSIAAAYVVSGVLRGRGQTLAHRPVTLMAQAPGMTEWVAVASASTGEHGRVRFDQPLAPGTGYLLAYAGGPRLAPSTSGAVFQ
jgi:hypothetical protein